MANILQAKLLEAARALVEASAIAEETAKVYKATGDAPKRRYMEGLIIDLRSPMSIGQIVLSATRFSFEMAPADQDKVYKELQNLAVHYGGRDTTWDILR